MLFMYLRNPDMKLFINSIIFTSSEWPDWLYILLAVPTVWLFLTGWACTLSAAAGFMILVYFTIFMLSEMK